MTRGETAGGYGVGFQSSKKQILSGKFMAASVSVGQIWKLCLGCNFIATSCPSLVF